MRIFGFVLVILGLLICLTIIGIPVGLFLIFVGMVLAIVGGHRKTVINNVIQVSNSPGPSALQANVLDGVERRRGAAQHSSPVIFTSEPRIPTGQMPLIGATPSVHGPEYRTTSAYKSNEPRNYDAKRWEILKEVDPDIAAAAQEVMELSPSYEDTFAEKFLALGDKKYLGALVNGIKQYHLKQEEEISRVNEYTENQRDEKKKQAYADRRARSLAMMEEIRAEGMICRHNGKHVTRMGMYEAKNEDDYGYAILFYSDGTEELRSGSYFTQVPI